MGFRLVPKSVTLNDFERRNDLYLAFFRRNSVVLRADYVKVVEGRPIQSTVKESSFNDISFMAIFAEIVENEHIIDRHLGYQVYIHFSIMTRLKVSL